MNIAAKLKASYSDDALPLVGKPRPDYILAACAIALSALGLLFIYSASSYSADLQFGDAFHYVKTQSIAFVLGVFALIFISYAPSTALAKSAFPLYLVGLALLGLVFVPVIGVESYGAKRWLNLGFFTIQPSEYAKFFTVMALALYASRHDLGKFSHSAVCLLLGGAVCVLLILEPNMSITVCMAAVTFIMLFVCGAKVKHLVAILIPAVAAAVLLILLEPYRLSRLLAFLDPWESPLEEGYQLIQSYYALGSGGLFGVGLFNSRQKYLFLPFAESDFILSVIGEEAGLFGVFVILFLFFIIAYRGIRIARDATSRFDCYLAAGITAVIFVQSLLNAAVVCGAIPPTGLPLPFVSAGGSSLVAYLAAVGVLLSISRRNRTFIRASKI